MAYDDRELFELPLNDAYKPKMHNLYSSLYTAVEADFILNVRKTPFPLRRVFQEVGMALPLRSFQTLTQTLPQQGTPNKQS